MSSLIPLDFPRGAPLGAVPGAQPKVLARKVDGQYLADPTEEEVRGRYSLCADLVVQLEGYRDRKSRESPDVDMQTLLRKIRAGVARKTWGLSEAEIDWIMVKLGWTVEPIGQDAGKRVSRATTISEENIPPGFVEWLTQTENDAPSVKTSVQITKEEVLKRLAARK